MMRASFLATALFASPALGQDSFFEDFSHFDPDRWHVAHYNFSHPGFDTDWRRSHAHINNGLTLTLAPHIGGKNHFAGASLRTADRFHFGRYSARMRAARGPGLVTGVFTYTGPYYGTRHDEIDIEILGRDTTQLHAAWFVDGNLEQRFIPLGFDAADCFHDYGFNWSPDRISWFVNGKTVFEITADEAELPQVPGHFFANLWAADPSIAQWAGLTVPDQTASAMVSSLGFTPASDTEIVALADALIARPTQP